MGNEPTIDESRRRRRRLLLYWGRAITSILASLVLGQALEQYDFWQPKAWLPWSYAVTQQVTGLTPRVQRPRFTSIVLVSDADYWDSSPSANCGPTLNRRRVAALVRRLDQAEAAVIAPDFLFGPADLPDRELACVRPSDDGGLPVADEGRSPSEELRAALVAAAQRRPVVLARELKRNPEGGLFVRESLFDAKGEQAAGILSGFASLPREIKAVPLEQLVEHGMMPSYPLAIARAYDPLGLAMDTRPESFDQFPVAHFLARDAFEPWVRTANDVLRADDLDLRRWAQHRVVLIGGTWHTAGPGLGAPVDFHETPAGKLDGVFLNANYVEAILDGRMLPVLGQRWLLAIDFGLSLLGALVLFLYNREAVLSGGDAGQTGVHASSVDHGQTVINGVLVLGWLALSYLAVINFGVYFDCLLPLATVILHSRLELTWSRIGAPAHITQDKPL